MKKHPRPRPSYRCSLAVEALEDRRVLSTGSELHSHLSGLCDCPAPDGASDWGAVWRRLVEEVRSEWSRDGSSEDRDMPERQDRSDASGDEANASQKPQNSNEDERPVEASPVVTLSNQTPKKLTASAEVIADREIPTVPRDSKTGATNHTEPPRMPPTPPAGQARVATPTVLPPRGVRTVLTDEPSSAIALVAENPTEPRQPVVAQHAIAPEAGSQPASQRAAAAIAVEAGLPEVARNTPEVDAPPVRVTAAGEAAQTVAVSVIHDAKQRPEVLLRGADANLGDLMPLPADETAGLLSADLTVLEQGLQRFLEQLDELGARLTAPVSSAGLTTWLLATMLAAGAFEVARRQMKSRPASLALVNGPWGGGLSSTSVLED